MSETMELKKPDPQHSPSYHEIAAKLINDRFLLSALEFHTELVESGREVRVLKDFFSNPGNFELNTYDTPSGITRSGSQATLDSLDLTRYSEDGEQSIDERVAVLEFQLRKAKETINALRNNLTVATESENNTPNKSTIHHVNVNTIKPHEQRALNYLINEYLLEYGYKLTSITFADENENQDFEDWDDVGLNISKPAGLLTIYREGLKQSGHNLVHKESQTPSDNLIDENVRKKLKNLEDDFVEGNLRISQLESQISCLRNDNEGLRKQNEALIQNAEELKKKAFSFIGSSKTSTVGSNSPEHFEIIEKSNLVKTDVSIEDNISSNSLNEIDWNDVTISSNNEQFIETVPEKNKDLSEVLSSNSKERIFSNIFEMELLKLCSINTPQKIDNDILIDLLNSGITTTTLTSLLSQSLLRIIPNIILNKREEAIPLLISAVLLCNDSNMRDKLLQQLFNLKKKPSEAERSQILTGIVGIAKFSKESLVENEVLPQCWEQLAHKYVERRLLVAESCVALIPYVSCTIRNSLLLSMLQQMLDDREDAVRSVVVRALSLVVALCDDKDKYVQCEDLALTILKDPSKIVVESCVEILFPVLARWALNIDFLTSHLIKSLLQKLNYYLKGSKTESPTKTIYPELVIKIMNVLNRLLPFILMYVANKPYVLERIEKDMAIEIRPDFLNICTSLTTPNNFTKSSINIGMIIYEFDSAIKETPKISWPELDWLIDNAIPDILNSLTHIELTQQIQPFIDFFTNLCITFGENCTLYKIAPIFRFQIENLEQVLSSYNQYSPSLNVIPVYLVSILTYCDKMAIEKVFKQFLFTLPLCGTPLDCLEITARELCLKGYQEIVVTILWDGVVHQRQLIRAASAGLFSSIVKNCGENLLIGKVTPAIVTLANDTDVLVRTATIPALGHLITDCNSKEVHDKAYMQLETYINDVTLIENHTLLRQIIVTMGNIVLKCKESFKDDVIFPKLHNLAMYTYQMTNQTRKVDMAAPLIEAFSKILFCNSLNIQKVNNFILPGLRYLEFVVKENPSLTSQYEIVTSLIKEVEGKVDNSSSLLTIEKSVKISTPSVEDVRQRVSKIFNNPVVNKNNPLPNLQGIFKKK
ncbi:RAB11-binding protein RELCH homolog [Onthophagus taurus]|uniref:RAB11-binding protein RELCH homolog n=1 Tax=Onthophagus taurus TaxID=166361 RepID=UPI0039BDE92A